MKTLLLIRKYLEDRTIGVICTEGFGDLKTLELPWNDNKVGQSCIPKGEYHVKRDKYGKHTWFSIPEVPGRTYIEIHEGYKPSHSLGCILLNLIDLQSLMIETKGEDFKLIVR